MRVTGFDGQTRDFYLCGSCATGRAPRTSSRWARRTCARTDRLCGWTLARAHARTGDNIAIAAYLGSSAAFEQAIAEFARVYADENKRDHAALREAIEAGRVAAEFGH